MPTLNALPDDVVARFRADVERLTGDDGAARFGIAVSGGPDSMAALLLANAAFPGRVEAATVDHGLRAASADEADHVAMICGTLNIAHQTCRAAVPRRGNVSANARAARYAALEEWRASRGLGWIVTAHHADDQLETVIMRLNRASGVGGLAGIRARSGSVVRPLLSWRRAELAAIPQAMGVATINDPSNTDDRYDRARLRKALAGADWLDPLAIVQSAANLADADDGLEWAVSRWRATASGPKRALLVEQMAALPWELRRRALIDCIVAVDPTAAPRNSALERLDRALASGKTMTLGKVICYPDGQNLRFELAPPRRIIAPPAD